MSNYLFISSVTLLKDTWAFLLFGHETQLAFQITRHRKIILIEHSVSFELGSSAFDSICNVTTLHCTSQASTCALLFVAQFCCRWNELLLRTEMLLLLSMFVWKWAPDESYSATTTVHYDLFFSVPPRQHHTTVLYNPFRHIAQLWRRVSPKTGESRCSGGQEQP